jgi:cobalt-zinc-cadmium efflux system membrane fusion protein
MTAFQRSAGKAAPEEVAVNETNNNVKLLEPPVLPHPAESPAAPPPADPPGRARRALVAWVGRALPTSLVLLALGALAVWGHQTGWTVPKFSALVGNGPAEPDDWCAAHSVPESCCVECNAKLLARPPAYGWCAKHGVHDCPLEHPDVAQAQSPPRVGPGDLERAGRALAFADRPENSKRCKFHPRRLQFASQEALDKAGVEMVPAWESAVEESVAVNGEVNYDPDGVTPLSTPVAGRLWRVLAQVGKAVHKDDVLALVDAAEVGKAKAEFLQALAEVSLRHETLRALDRGLSSGAVPEATYRSARAALRQAQIRLVAAQQVLGNLGLPIRAEDVRHLAPGRLGERLQFLGLEALADGLKAEKASTANLLPVKAPRDGVVVVRRAAAGQVVDPAKTLFVVADPRRMWLTLHVRPEALKPFRQTDPRLLLQGRIVHFRPDGTREDVTARVAWVNTAVDERTRTLEVRADLPNPGGRLRANTFGAGRIVLREEPRAVVVPDEAVHWDGGCHVVFVYDKHSPGQDAPKVFHVRSVRPGARYDGNTEIIAGLLAGEMVAAKGSGALRAELLKGNLGEA